MKKLFLTLFAFLSLVSGFAAGAAGYGAANSSMLVNNLDNAILRSTVVSPLAAGAGHVVGGTVAGLFQGQKLGEAVINSFDGFGRSMVIGAAVGITTTIAVSYAQGINPWTGKAIVGKGTVNNDFFEGARYSDKVLNQMENTQDLRHSFPRSVDGYANEYGYQYTRTGGDGQIYQYLELPGIYKGQ
jgi:hypothetical protein